VPKGTTARPSQPWHGQLVLSGTTVSLTCAVVSPWGFKKRDFRVFGGGLKTNRSSFRLGLALNSIRENKVVISGLFWVVFWIKAYGIMFIN